MTNMSSRQYSRPVWDTSAPASSVLWARMSVGDVVSTIPAFSLNKYSTYGEVILAPDHAVVKHPDSLSFVEAASVWMMFLTAYGSLIFDSQVKRVNFVIVPAASSSVGLAAI